MAGKRKDDDGSRERKPSKKKKRAKETDGSTAQPPPPEIEGSEADVPWEHDDDEHRDRGKHHDHHRWESEVAEAIYTQLIEVRKVVENLRQEAQEAKLRRRSELAPVRVGDLMRGFQSAVAKANRSTRAGEQDDGEDIERMSIKDLEVSVQAPIIEGAHAEDPVVMLPNIKSVDAETASISLKFTVVSVPLKQRG